MSLGADASQEQADGGTVFRVHAAIGEIAEAEWNRLAGPQPFLQHAFLHILEDTGCVGGRSGWLPQHLALWQGERLAAAMPLYLKTHSYGEYVFDWAWADAYERNGLPYYPKLLSAIPFTPVTGTRLLGAGETERKLLIAAALQYVQNAEISSFHCLFPNDAERGLLEEAGLMIRHGVQFHWLNHGYGGFDDYLTGMSHDKRKKIRQERRRVHEGGIRFRALTGADITEADWEFFASCYENTYRQHRSMPYLNLDFFRTLGRVMPENLVLIVASEQDRDVAAALNMRDETTLYGRYWGAHVYVPGLHFETCYYQAIEFCIAHGIRKFEGGAQGEHKLARGFLPERTYSAHWLAHPDFADAIEKFLSRESRHMTLYIDELNEHSPYKG